MPKMGKTRGNPAHRQWAQSGSTIPITHTLNDRQAIASILSTVEPTYLTHTCTQIVHTLIRKTTEAVRHFSASSTAPIITTTIYI